MKTMKNLAKPLLIPKLQRLILVRLLVVTFFLTLGAIIFDMHPLVYYGVLSSAVFLSLAYTIWLVTERTLGILTYLQIFIDLSVITVFVHYTGGVDSVLATLYALPILSAGFLLFPYGPLVLAGLSGLLFTGLVALEHFHWIPPILPPVGEPFHIPRDIFYTAYMTYVRVTILVLVGFLTEYLVRTVNRMERHIETYGQFSLLGEMAAHLAHEIKNPLLAISGSIEVLHEDLKSKLSAKDQKLMEAIVQESQRLNELFEQVLDYARPLELDLQKVRLKELLDEVFILFETSLVNGQDIRVHRIYAGEPDRWISADRNRIKQVFINIIWNAVQAMPQGGDLFIDACDTSSACQIRFKDTGVGMDRKTKDSLFVPFRSLKVDGTGIGLAIAYRIVKSHGGKIQVKSRPGSGSVFTVALPRA